MGVNNMSNFDNTTIYLNAITPYKVQKVTNTGLLTAGTKTDDGFYTGGRIILRQSSMTLPQIISSKYNCNVQSSSVTIDVNQDNLVAILAIPIHCAFTAVPTSEYSVEWKQKLHNTLNPYVYVMVWKSTTNPSWTVLNGIRHTSNNYYNDFTEGIITSTSIDRELPTSTDISRFSSNVLSNYLDQAYNESDNYSSFIKKTVHDTVKEKLSEHEVFSTLSYQFLPILDTGGSSSGFKKVGILATVLYSSIPVFSWNNMDEMSNYFNRNEYNPDNTDGLISSELDLSTDWKIYVKGAQNPTIVTTWKSAKLEEFLESDNNKTGLTKENIAVEFRYPLYKHTGLLLGLSESEYTEESLVYDGGYNYNSNKSDTYEGLMFQNYPYLKERFEVDSYIYGENSEPRIETEKEFYAQLQFRLKINNKKFSSWSYFKIGVIGSPNISSFSEMENEGNVLPNVVRDNSTVEIIYGELPDEGDPDYKDPTPDPPDIDPTDPTPINPVDGGLNLLTTSYIMTESQLNQLASFLWGATFLQNLQLLNNSPIENIVGCKMIPVSLSGSDSVVKIGNVDTNVNGAIVSSVPVITVGSITIGGLYGNFLDYAPYTQVTLFLPFIGFTEIDPNVVVDNTLTIKYVFDIVTGACKAMLYVNDIYYMSYDGICSIDMPLVASNRAQTEAQLFSSVVNGAISGNVGGLVDAVATTQYHSQSSGKYSPTCGWQEAKQAYAIINRPTCQYPETYGHNIGYPCKLSRSLNSLSGFTVCDSSVDVSGISCTETERQEIYNALTSGVYI